MKLGHLQAVFLYTHHHPLHTSCFSYEYAPSISACWLRCKQTIDLGLRDLPRTHSPYAPFGGPSITTRQAQERAPLECDEACLNTNDYRHYILKKKKMAHSVEGGADIDRDSKEPLSVSCLSICLGGSGGGGGCKSSVPSANKEVFHGNYDDVLD